MHAMADGPCADGRHGRLRPEEPCLGIALFPVVGLKGHLLPRKARVLHGLHSPACSKGFVSGELT